MQREQFLQALDELSLSYSDDIYEKFEIYTNYLLEYNENVNLTAIKDRYEIYIKHYLDCISILKYFDIKENARVIDIGTGAGFPTIPVKLMRKDLDMCMVDSLNKRVTFLENVIKKLELDKIIAIHSRAEDMANKKEYRESFDIAISRAVANLSTLSEYCTPFIKKGGYLVCLKGQNVEDEIKNSANAMKKLNCKIIDKIDVSIPYSDLHHNIVVIKKIDTTPKAYPRKAGTPVKNPL